jgi:NAD(P)-dependent dehydrogenase (short-subunit alcohol dehydrogenase family)
MRGRMTAYAASKAGLAALTEGIRLDVLDTPDIRVSTMLPGYIRTELTQRHERAPFIVELEAGCRELAAAIEREPALACVPRWPWQLIAVGLRFAPLRLLARFS